MNTAPGTWDMPVANKAPGGSRASIPSNSAGCLEYEAMLRKKAPCFGETTDHMKEMDHRRQEAVEKSGVGSTSHVNDSS